jgi:hypothetical protein
MVGGGIGKPFRRAVRHGDKKQNTARLGRCSLSERIAAQLPSSMNKPVWLVVTPVKYPVESPLFWKMAPSMLLL